jgi:hypothetical protein
MLSSAATSRQAKLSAPRFKTNAPPVRSAFKTNAPPVRSAFKTNAPPVRSAFKTNAPPVRSAFKTNAPPVCVQPLRPTRHLCVQPLRPMRRLCAFSRPLPETKAVWPLQLWVVTATWRIYLAQLAAAGVALGRDEWSKLCEASFLRLFRVIQMAQ